MFCCLSCFIVLVLHVCCCRSFLLCIFIVVLMHLLAVVFPLPVSSFRFCSISSFFEVWSLLYDSSAIGVAFLGRETDRHRQTDRQTDRQTYTDRERDRAWPASSVILCKGFFARDLITSCPYFLSAAAVAVVRCLCLHKPKGQGPGGRGPERTFVAEMKN